MNELVYSENDINEAWNDLRLAEKELEAFQSKDSETKKAIIERIRDKVEILVKTKSIPIKENQISKYVLNILKEKNIQYDRHHFYDLFSESQKGNYSKVAYATIHEHDFKIISENENGKWEQCGCGTNKINGIEQSDISLEDEGEQTLGTVRETIAPDSIHFEYLKIIRELFQKNIAAIDMIFQKCTLDITSIKKQTIENKRRRALQADYEKLYNMTKITVGKRCQIVKEELSDITEKDVKEAHMKLTETLNAIKKLNDRTKITNYEKAMAKILIERFGYLHGNIASILNITTKHVKNNILKANQKNNQDQDGMLEQLDFLARCPGCGLGIADVLDRQYEQYKKGKPITENFTLDSYPFPTFAQQVIQQKQVIRKQKITIQQLRDRQAK